MTIGCTGIGGVLVVPFLIYALRLPARAAIAVALWSYLLSGPVAVLFYARRGSIPWSRTAWLCVAALPAAYLGARALEVVPPSVLEGLIAALLLVAGLHALRGRDAGAAQPRELKRGALAALGGVTGFGSALIGAGGAVILVPLLIGLGEPVLAAVGMSQAIQVPIAAVASAANLRAGSVDLRLGTLLAAALAIGIAVGTPLAHSLPQEGLRRLVGWTMLLAGAAIVARLLTSGA